MVLVGKHHIVFGTEHGKLISLNTNEHHEPRVTAIPFSTGDNDNNKILTTATTHVPSTSQFYGANPNTLNSSFTSTSPLTSGVGTNVIGGVNSTINAPNLPVPSIFTPHALLDSP